MCLILCYCATNEVPELFEARYTRGAELAWTRAYGLIWTELLRE
jgi:hypothetical protein